MTEKQEEIYMENRNNQQVVIQTLDLSDKNFKITLIKKFKNIEGKIKNSSRDLESIRESMHILDPKIQYVKLKLIFIRSSRTKDN